MPIATNTPTPIAITRRDRLLQQGSDAWEDPVCSCEPEPRWLRFQNDHSCPAKLSEWESIERPPSDEL